MVKITAIVNGPDVKECAKKFAAVNGSALIGDIPVLTDAQLDVICLYSPFTAHVNAVKTALRNECVSGENNKLLYRDGITPLEKQCKDHGKTLAPTPAPTTTKPEPTTATPEPTKPIPTKPVPTTERPNSNGAALARSHSPTRPRPITSFPTILMKFIALTLAFAAIASAADVPHCDDAKVDNVIRGASYAECTRRLEAISNATIPATMTSTTPTPVTPERMLEGLSDAQDAYLNVLCLSDPCVGFLKELKAAAPSECTYGTIPNSLLLYHDQINRIEDLCKANGKTVAPTPAPTTATPEPTPRPGCQDSQ